jgi:hypothetical protein
MKDSSHWYYRSTGLPCYEVECKSKPGQMRPTTIRDARELDLVPSVSTIGKIIYSPSLENWKAEQIVKAAWETPEVKQTEDGCVVPLTYVQWKLEVLELADEISSTAADTGSAIHKAVEEYLTTGTCVGEYYDWQKTFAKWWLSQSWFNMPNEYTPNIQSEDYIGTEFGYGGRYDIYVGGSIIIDLKTQNAKGKPFKFYRSWGRQLAAYAQPLKATRLISVAIDSQDSSKIEAFEWPDREKLLTEFMCAQILWLSENDLTKKGK